MRFLARSVVVLGSLAFAGCASSPSGEAPPAAEKARTSPLEVVVVRLVPGDDLKQALERVVRERHLEAACVLSCAGSLTRAAIRYADRPEATTLEEKLEIVSLSGTLSSTAGSHLHIAVANGEGRTLGGHLKDGSLVYTTAEVAIGVAPGVRLSRRPDARTGYPELFVEEVR